MPPDKSSSVEIRFVYLLPLVLIPAGFQSAVRKAFLNRGGCGSGGIYGNGPPERTGANREIPLFPPFSVDSVIQLLKQADPVASPAETLFHRRAPCGRRSRR